MEELAFEIKIEEELLRRITINAGLPRLPLFLQILVRLDADVVGFFRRVELGLKKTPLPRYFNDKPRRLPLRQKLGRRAMDFLGKIDREIKEILEDVPVQNRDSDIMRFKNTIDNRNHFEKHHHKERKWRLFTLGKVFQSAHMLGMRPSEILKHAGNLKSYAQMNN